MKYKRFLFLLIIVFVCAFGFVGCKSNNANKQVPVYQGMVLSDVSGNELSQALFSYIEPYAGRETSHGKPGGWHGGDTDKRNDEVNNENPFGKPDGSDTEEKVSSLVVVGSPQEGYYAEKNEKILITVKIHNPDKFEIMSFTLNGNKYSSYMFEDGSDMENLILKVDVGDVCGIKDYTIDAIKYIDDSIIKNVLMDGEKTVKIAVKADKEPVATVSNQQILADKISFDVNISDELDLISKSEGQVKAVLYDGTDIVSQKDLIVGQNNIVFDGLNQNMLYEYVIVSAYDNYSLDEKVHILQKQAFYTETYVLFDSTKIEITKTSAKWDYNWNVSIENKVIEKQELYLDEKKVADIAASDRQVKNLLSNKEYLLKATYKDKNNENQIIELKFITHSKVMPVVEIANLAVNKRNIEFDITVQDDDQLIKNEKLILMSGQNKIVEFDNFDISNINDLSIFTDYELVIEFEYDLNDGNGVNKKHIIKEFKTLPDISISSIKLSQNKVYGKGDILYIQMNLESKIPIEYTYAIINGKKYDLNSNVSGSMLFISIEIDESYSGGNTEFVVEKIAGIINGSEYIAPQSVNNKVTAFIEGPIYFKTAYFVDEDLNKINTSYISESEYDVSKIRVIYEFDNPTGYQISSIGNQTNIEKIDNNKWIINPVKNENQYSEENYLTSDILYSSTYSIKFLNLNSEEKVVETEGCWLKLYILCDSNNKKYISTVDELKTNNNGFVVLENDLDFEGVNWESINFSGILDGNGFAIKNLSTTLIENLDGEIRNLNFENCIIVGSGDAIVANKVDTAYRKSIFYNCHIDENSVLIGESGLGSFAGYIYLSTYDSSTGSYNGMYFLKCSTNAKIVSNSANENSYNIQVGGFVYNYDYYISLLFMDCIDNSIITGNYARFANDGYVGSECINCLTFSGNEFYSPDYNYGSYANYVILTKPYIDGMGISHEFSAIIYNRKGYGQENAISKTLNEVNLKEFWTDILGWSEEVWNFDNLDIENGIYPTLRK